MIDNTDFKTPKTGLTIANTDIKLIFEGGTTQTSKNSGGATEIGSTGTYYCTFDATDSATLGRLHIDIQKAGALPYFMDTEVLPALVWDALYAASGGAIMSDVQTIKTQAVTCAAGVTVGAFVGNATAALGVDASGRIDIGKALGTAVTLDANNVLNVSSKYWAGTAITATSIPVATSAGAAGGLFIAGSNAATTISGLTTGALSCTTITASGAVAFQSTFAVTTSTSLAALSATTVTFSGAVAFQSTFAVTTSTSLAALSCTTLTASGAVAFQSTFAVTTSTSLAALSCTTLTASGAVAFQSTFATTGTTTFNAFTVTNATTLSGAVSLGSTLGVTGTATFAAITTTGTVTMNAFTVTNATTLSGAVSLGSTLGVTGATTLAALSMTTLTASGAVALQSTVTVTGATSLAALSMTTLTASGAVAFQSTFAVTTSTSLGALSATTVTASGAVAFQSTFVVAGATTLTGAVTASNASNNIVGISLAAAGFDPVLIESSIVAGASLTNDAGTQLTSINGRQAISLLLSSAAAGVLAGAATATITIKPGGLPSGNTRITATVDANGNRSALTLKVPT